MTNKTETKHKKNYPLSARLTRRVLHYLNLFRLLVALGMGMAMLLPGSENILNLERPALAAAAIIAYIAVAIYFIFVSNRRDSDPYAIALQTLAADLVILTLLLRSFGGLTSGLGILLVFLAGSAAVLLPTKLAALFAALASLAIIGEHIYSVAYGANREIRVIQTGFYGLATFSATFFAWLLSRWAGGYELLVRQHAAKLSDLEQVNELIIRRMRTGILAVDQENAIHMMNESAWFALGSPPNDQRNLEEIAPELVDVLQAWRGTEQQFEHPLTLSASQSTIVPKIIPMSQNMDVEALIFLEDNDIVARRAQQISSVSLAKLSGSIAHEIRNPLAAVSNAAQLLEEAEALDEQDGRLVEMIRNNTKRMNGIVENILQLSRREQSRPEVIHLNPWLQDFHHEFLTNPQYLGLDLTVNMANEDIKVLFDASQLHQALWKLTDNASQHAGSEQAPARIQLISSADPDAGWAVVTVSDNGGGIPEDKIANIFEPFFTTRKAGSGLGLYIAKQLCEANQAELTVDSTVGTGTQFHIRMPTAGTQARPTTI